MKMNIKYNQAASQNIYKLFEAIKKDNDVLNLVGDRSVLLLKAAIKQNKDEYNAGKPLNPDYVNYRSKLAKKNQPAITYRKPKPNVFTGEFVESMKFRIIQGDSIELFFDGEHSQYTGLKGKPIGKKVMNNDLMTWLNKLRPFLFLSESIKVKIQKNLIAKIKQKLSSYKKFL